MSEAFTLTGYWGHMITGPVISHGVRICCWETTTTRLVGGRVRNTNKSQNRNKSYVRYKITKNYCHFFFLLLLFPIFIISNCNTSWRSSTRERNVKILLFDTYRINVRSFLGGWVIFDTCCGEPDLMQIPSNSVASNLNINETMFLTKTFFVVTN